MLIAAFATQLIQALCFFFVYLGPADLQASAQSVGQWLGVPALGFVFAGTYFLFRDFAKQLSQRQAEILNPEANV
jgi:hypothetical protein